MLIACANVANLLLVRAEARQQELAHSRRAGRGRGRIVRELLVESVLLGLMGGALGVGVAYAGLRLLVAIGPANLPRLSEISLDARALAFTAGAFAALGAVLRIDPGSEIRRAADFRRLCGARAGPRASAASGIARAISWWWRRWRWRWCCW